MRGRGQKQQQHRDMPRGPCMATVPTAPPGHHPSYQQPCPGCHRDVTSGDSWTLQLPTARHTGLGSYPQNHQQPPSSIHSLLSVPPRERDHRAGSQAQGHDHLPVPRWVARKCQRPWNYRSVEDPLQPALRLLRRAQPGCGARGSLETQHCQHRAGRPAAPAAPALAACRCQRGYRKGFPG